MNYYNFILLFLTVCTIMVKIDAFYLLNTNNRATVTQSKLINYPAEKRETIIINGNTIRLAVNTFIKYHKLLKSGKKLNFYNRKVLLKSYFKLKAVIKTYMNKNFINKMKVNQILTIFLSQKNKHH